MALLLSIAVLACCFILNLGSPTGQLDDLNTTASIVVENYGYKPKQDISSNAKSLIDKIRKLLDDFESQNYGTEAPKNQSLNTSSGLVALREIYKTGYGMDLIFSAVLRPLTGPIKIAETFTVTVAYTEPYKPKPYATEENDYPITVFSSYYRPELNKRLIFIMKFVDGLDLDSGDRAIIGMALNYPDFQMQKLDPEVIERQLLILKAKGPEIEKELREKSYRGYTYKTIDDEEDSLDSKDS